MENFKVFCANYWRELALFVCSLVLMGFFWYFMSIYPMPKMWCSAGGAMLLANVFMSLLFVAKKSQKHSYDLYAVVWGIVVLMWMYIGIYWGIMLQRAGHFKSIGEYMIIFLMIFIALFVFFVGVQMQQDELLVRKSSEAEPEQQAKTDNLLEFPFKGKIAEKVEDFSSPRYVYEDGYETEEPDGAHGKMVGYRISPDLIVSFYWISDENGKGLIIYANFDHVLIRKEVEVLRNQEEAVNVLREKVGLSPIRV